MSKAELNYIVIKNELLAVVHSLNKFRHYIIGYQTFGNNNHAVIRYLMNKPYVNARIIRWFLLLQQFDLTIIDKPGKENVLVDFLSRVNLPTGEEGMVDDQMMEEHQFSVLVLSPWFADITNYLVLAQFPPHLSSKEKRKIVRKSTSFTWIGGNLFKICLDQILRRCVREEEVFYILLTCHNRQVEVTNRPLEGILTKAMSSSRKNWANRLVEATWAYNTTWKAPIRFTPY